VEPFGVAQPDLLVWPFVVVGAGAVARAQRTGRRMCSGRPQLLLPRVPLQPLQLSPPQLLVSLELPPPPLVGAHHPAPLVVVVPTRVSAAEAAAAVAGDPRVVQLQPGRPPLVVAAPQVENTSSRLWWTSCDNSRRGVQLKRTGTRSLSWRCLRPVRGRRVGRAAIVVAVEQAQLRPAVYQERHLRLRSISCGLPGVGISSWLTMCLRART